MALKFNNGYGALTCDGCGTMIAQGGDGSRPWVDVMVQDTIEIPCDPRPFAFCKRACVVMGSARSDISASEHEACEAYLKATTPGGKA